MKFLKKMLTLCMLCGIIASCGFGFDVQADEIEIDLSLQEA